MMTAEPSSERPTRPVRWLPGLIALLLSAPAVLAAWFVADVASDGDRTVQMIAGIAMLAAVVLAQAVWWLFFARLSIRQRVVGGLCVAAAAAALAASLRIEGHTGEMLPERVAWRWSQTPEQRAVAYFRSRESRLDASPEPRTIAATEEDWPQYRGPNRDGVASIGTETTTIRTDWNDAPPPVLWRHEVGPAWSGFAVVGDLLFTQEQRGDDEVVACYDAATGRQRWAHANKARFSESLGGDGPRATPVFADGAVYALGATGLLDRLNPADGSLVWSRDTLKDAGGDRPIPNIAWGMAASPAVRNGRVCVAPGGGIDRGVIAYDAATGEPAWYSRGGPVWETDDPAAAKNGKVTMASYAAPRVETIHGLPQLLVFDGEGLKSYDLDSGRRLWTFGPWVNQPKVNASQPIVQGNRVFLGSGYTIGGVQIEVRRDGDRWSAAEVWRNKLKLKFNDAILHAGHLYGLDEGILTCHDWETGKQKWKKGRYGYGQLILVGETLIVLAEDGSLAAVAASTDRYTELARIDLLDGKTWNHPAFARGFLYVRNDREAACVDLRPARDRVASTR